ncbi:carbohydrate ABC transporter permease [Dactylosporangium sp. NPDC048998]|uniref:carbohydrate ABC transporter permease n=1 Tax=Dactylosporangium sp. NPDC048998 TaxID=3363976 RepID=UPI0037151000
MPARRAGHARRQRRGRVLVHAAAYAAAIIGAGPFLWSMLTAVKLNRDLYDPAHNPLWFNDPPTADHLVYLWQHTAFRTFAWNTLWIGAAVVAVTLLLATPAGWVLARLRRPWAGHLGMVIFLCYLVPPSVLFLPLSRLIAGLGLQDSAWALVVVYPTMTVPVSVWLLMGFFSAVPRQVEEQARVDGCTRFAAFRWVALPLAVPGLVAVVVLSFVLCASEYLYATAFVARSAGKVLSTGIPTELIGGDLFYWQSLQGAVVLVAVPVAVVFNLLLKRFVAGFTAGAVTLD